VQTARRHVLHERRPRNSQVEGRSSCAAKPIPDRKRKGLVSTKTQHPTVKIPAERQVRRKATSHCQKPDITGDLAPTAAFTRIASTECHAIGSSMVWAGLTQGAGRDPFIFKNLARVMMGPLRCLTTVLPRHPPSTDSNPLRRLHTINKSTTSHMIKEADSNGVGITRIPID
jgi:hypothetical protein